jgi:DtxR family manganese transport transcriptional regulator
MVKKSKALLPPAKRQTQAFEHTRNARRSAVREDYLELIADLIDSSAGRPVRAVDLVNRLGVTQPTVAKMISRLRREGFLARGQRADLELTRDGRAVAIKSKKRHEIVLRFLLSLGLSRSIAERDAEGLKHHVSDATLSALEAFKKRRSARAERRGQLSLL